MQPSSKHLLLAFSSMALFTIAGGAAAQLAGADMSPKGIYHDVDRYQRTGIKFHITMDERGAERQVPVSYPFQSGDRFKFTFEINRGTYVYVINRTELHRPSGVSAGYQAKRIRPSRVSYDTALGEPRLLFPTHLAGVNNRVKAGVAREIPHKGTFAMDHDSGIEKLYVVISGRKLDLGPYFDAATGTVRRHYGAPDPAAVSLLETRLAEWKSNAAVELVPKGIVHQVDSYGVSIDPSRPAVVEIDLKHYR